MSQPYRSANTRPVGEVPSELVLEWNDTEARASWPRFTLATSFVLVSTVVVAQFSAVASLIVLLGGVLVLARVFRATATTRIAVKVKGPDILITVGPAMVRSYPLRDLRQVGLDRKAIQRLTYQQPVGAAMPSTEVGASVDIARITFDLEGEYRAPWLCETFASYGECIDRYGKLRAFLRKHGWVPIDERGTDRPPTA